MDYTAGQKPGRALQRSLFFSQAFVFYRLQNKNFYQSDYLNLLGAFFLC
jgi:hypothetical protein